MLQNYLSVARCSVSLRPLNFLVGQNGAGKSNFLDSLRFVADSLNSSVEHALRDRGGIGEVRRRSAGHPTHFGIRLEWMLPDGTSGVFAFRIGAKAGAGFVVQEEQCVVHAAGPMELPARYRVQSGRIVECSIESPPAASGDRLFLVAISGQPEFRPLYDALTRMGFYNFSPEVIREPQAPDPGEVLAANGVNLAGVLKRLSEPAHADRRRRVIDLLGRVVPGISGVEHRPIGRKETLEFRQKVAGSREDWRFSAESISDGTLRTLGVLVALYQPPAEDGRRVRVVGIEEPETALHPGAAAILRDALLDASRHTQVVVTSHSPDLLDDAQVDANDLISVTCRDGETHLGPVDEASRSAVQDRLYTAGELLRLNQLETDPACFRDKASAQAQLFDTP